MTSFGVGCWLFEPVGVRSGNKSAEELALNPALYLEKVKLSLTSIPSISNLKTSHSLDFEFFPYEEKEDSRDDGTSWVLRSSTFRPQISGGFIHFNIRIPIEVQDSISNDGPEIGENFEVRMKFLKDFPVTFITCKDTQVEISRPSHAMMVVREFLKSELEMRHSLVNLRVLGPSPFWADFFVLPAPTSSQSLKAIEKEPIEYEIEKYRGMYSDVNCYWQSSQFPNSVEATKRVFRELTPELSLYYSIVSEKNLRVRRSWKISELLEQLVEYYGTDKQLMKVARFFRAGKLSRSLLLEVRLIQLLANKQKLRFSGELTELYSGEKTGTLRESLENEISGSVTGEDLGTENLAILFESRRATEINLLILVIASLLGGLAGALFNGLLTK